MAALPTWTVLGGGYQSYLKGNFDDAHEEWLPLAELGDIEAQFNMGVIYDEGAGVQQDLAIAAKWYEKAAQQGFVDAQANLGMMYYHGQGVPCDHKKAAGWLQMAADQGDAEARDLIKKLSAGETRDSQGTHS